MTAHRVHDLLKRTSRVLLWTSLAATGLRWSFWLLAAAVVLIFIDAVAALPPAGLIVLDLMLAAVATAVAVSLGVVLYQGRFQAQRVAVLIEQRLALSGSRLINAIELAGHTPAGASAPLAELAVEQGNTLAEQLDPRQVVIWSDFKRSLMFAATGLLGALAIYLILPGVFHAVVPRMVQPYADLPPFTRLQFDVTIEPQPVYHSRPATITADLSGPAVPQRAEVVFADADGSQQRVLMLRPVESAQAGNASAGKQRFVMRIDRAEVSRRFYIATAEGRSPWYQLEVKPVPLFEKLYVTYDYPPYTGWEDAQQPVGSAGLSALVGTRATLRVHSNVLLGGGSIVVTSNDKSGNAAPQPREFNFTPDPADPTQATAVIPIEADAHFTASLEGADGTPGYEPFVAPIKAIPDDRPRIHVMEPEARVIVPEGYTVPFVVQASDDITVDRLRISRGVNGWGPAVAELPLEFAEHDHKHATARGGFDLAQLGAKAGDVITYYFTAYDNLPPDGQFTDSDVLAIQVITQEEYLEYERTRYRIDDLHAEWEAYQARLDQLEAMRNQILKDLEKLRKKLDSGQPLTDQEQLELKRLEEQLNAYTDQTLALVEDLNRRAEDPQLYEFEQQYKDLLRRLSAELQSQVNPAAALQSSTRQLQSQDSQDARQMLAKRAEQFRQNQKPFTEETDQQREQTQQDIEALAMADELITQGERVRQVAMEQQDLAQRLAEYKQKSQLTEAEQQRADALAQQQAALERELTEASTALRDAAQAAQQRLPKMSAGAMKVANAIDQGQITQDMDNATTQAIAGDGRGAYASAKAAADKLDALLSDCQSMGQQAGDDLDGCFGLPREQMRQALQQMAQGRGMPGMPGQGQEGGTGAGYAGSQARMAIRGPRSAQGQGGGAEGRLSSGDGEGQGAGETRLEHMDPTDALSPGEFTTRGADSSALPGVPLQYREEAEAYFQRLADDSKQQP